MSLCVCVCVTVVVLEYFFLGGGTFFDSPLSKIKNNVKFFDIFFDIFDTKKLDDIISI